MASLWPFTTQTATAGTVELAKVLKRFKVEPQHRVLKEVVILLKKLGVLAIDVTRPGNGYWLIPNVEIDEETEEVTPATLDVIN